MTNEEIFNSIEKSYRAIEGIWNRCERLLYLIELKRRNPIKYRFCSMFNGSRGMEEQMLACYESAMMGLYYANEGFIRDLYPEINAVVWTKY